MTKELKVREFLNEHNGYIRTSDFLNLYICKPNIPKYIDLGLVRRVGHGLYLDNKKIEDEYYIFQNNYPTAIFSHQSALYLLHLTDKAPFKLDVTVLKDKKVRGNKNVHKVSKNHYALGIIEIDSPYGNKIKVYNAERSICDLIRTKNKITLELQNKIITNYLRSKEKDLNQLRLYAKTFYLTGEVDNLCND